MFEFDLEDFKKYLKASKFFEKYEPQRRLIDKDIELNKKFYEDYGYYAPIGDFRDLIKGIEIKISKFEPLEYYTPREYSYKEYCEFVNRRFENGARKTKMRDFWIKSAKKCFEKHQRFLEGTPADWMDGHKELHKLQKDLIK